MMLSRDHTGAAAKVASPSKGSPKAPETLEILVNLLEARGLNETAKCLQCEAGLSSFGAVSAPGTEEVFQSAEWLRVAQAEQRRQLESMVQEMPKREQQMSRICDLVHRVGEAASNVKRPTLEDMNEQIKVNRSELQELDVIASEQDAFACNLRVKVDGISGEVTELMRTLEEREVEEATARLQLTRLEDEAQKLSCELEAVPVMTQVRKIQGLLNTWHDQDGHLQVLIRQLFLDMDRDKDGRLEWNDSEIRGFVRELFSRNGVMFPTCLERVWYELYRKADVDECYSLDLREAMSFAFSCFEATLALVLTGQAENGIDSDLMGEQWTTTHMSAPMAHSSMTYSSGVVIDFLDCAQVFRPVIAANTAYRTRLIRLIETGEHLKATMKTYRECDTDGKGQLTYREVLSFISCCFGQHGLNAPSEEQMLSMYNKFVDNDEENALDMRDCLELVDAIFRTTFIVEKPENHKATVLSQPVKLVRASMTHSSSSRQIIGTSESVAKPKTPTQMWRI